MRYREQQNKLKPAIPYLFLYDEDGGQMFHSDGAFHIWDMTKVKTNHFQYTDDTNKVILGGNSSGYFLIEFDCSFQTYADDVIEVKTSIYKNDVELLESSVITTISGDAQNPTVITSQHIHYVIYLERGDSIKIHTESNVEDWTYSMEATSRLLISFIPMAGWDNSAGGREDYKGGIPR